MRGKKSAAFGYFCHFSLNMSQTGIFYDFVNEN